MPKLSQRAALVTGGGRGIGSAAARMLAAEGARVVVADLDAEPAHETATAIREAGGEAVALVADVAATGFGEQAVEATLDSFGGIDIVVNNAGYVWNTTIQKTSDEQWQAMYDVHVLAPFRILRAAAPYFRQVAEEESRKKRATHRKVVNVSSLSGTQGQATQLAYASAKAAVVGMTKSLAKEWGRYRVNVNCVAFGYIATRLTQPIGPEGATIEVHGRRHKVGMTRQFLDSLPHTVALGRGGTPEEAAGAILLLCFPESDYITGHVLECSGLPLVS